MAEGTMYVVLGGSLEYENTYEVIGNYAAPNASAAIREAVKERNSDGTYVAVPVRSFQLVTVDIESTTRVKLS